MAWKPIMGDLVVAPGGRLAIVKDPFLSPYEIEYMDDGSRASVPVSQLARPPYVDFIVYGDFTEPTKGVNFIVVRRPSGRFPFQKKLVPAIEKLIRPWFPADATSRRDRLWNVDGDPLRPGQPMLWQTKVARRFEWDAATEQLVEAT